MLLNMDSDVLMRRVLGRAFHSLGPATENALSPNLVDVLGIVSSMVMGHFKVIKSVRYDGI